MCKIIDGLPAGVEKLWKTIAAAGLYYNFTGSEKCFQMEHESDDHGLHSWNWQVISLSLSLHGSPSLSLSAQVNTWPQECTEMVMPMSASNGSMFPPYDYDYEEFASSCDETYGVWPRSHWITTEYGGHVSPRQRPSAPLTERSACSGTATS